MLAICEHLVEADVDLSILLVTGSPVIHNLRIPARLDYIKLPCLTRRDYENIDISRARLYRSRMADNTRLSDADLIAKCLKQDAEAWEVLVRRYQRLIASITFKFGLSSEDAADISQSVCVALFQQLPSLRKQAKLSSWIITVTVRECWKFRRRQAPTESLDHPERETPAELADPSQQSPDEWLLSLERHHLLRQGIEPLPEHCRQLIEHLFYGEEALPYAEISRRMGMPIASIGPTRARCLEKLRASLKNIGFF